MIDHVRREVTDLERSARFYDAVFFALGVRRLRATPGAIAYGVDHPRLWLVASRTAVGGNDLLALAARGKAAVDAAYEVALGAGGFGDGAPGPRPEQGRRCYSASVLDPDGLRVEVVTGTAE